MKKYHSIPYATGGRSFAGADCYGLVILYFREELGIQLADYTYENTKDVGSRNMLLGNCDAEFIEVPLKDAIKNDLVFFELPDYGIAHCGVMVNDRNVMQITEHHGCTITKLSRYGNVHSIHRHKELC